ncbi:hypothetical protein MAR_014537 [Mya arenaria]|uniref:Uncharacterized protein n=1 Tax=Mya arenaria TaxID=6604 RepID=A0ABY7G310_MYAAR|nr:hypothetical protein MAR_014537 [Mya arenaria]
MYAQQDLLGAENANFEEMPKYALNNHLRMFFESNRTVKDEELKKIHYSLCEVWPIKVPEREMSYRYFKRQRLCDCNKNLQCEINGFAEKGKGSVVHKPQIADHHMKKLMDPAKVAFNVNTPCGLQNKVLFDIMYYPCRRGRENLREMKKTTFAVEVHSSGREYVRQIMDEADKNHGVDSTPDDTMVKQECIPGQISNTAALSQKYPNHCIRATSISALDIAAFEARQIIRVTGHKSETSIESYASRLTEGTKREMLDALSIAFLGAEVLP